MTDATNIMSLRGFPPWRVFTLMEMKRCRRIYPVVVLSVAQLPVAASIGPFRDQNLNAD